MSAEVDEVLQLAENLPRSDQLRLIDALEKMMGCPRPEVSVSDSRIAAGAPSPRDEHDS